MEGTLPILTGFGFGRFAIAIGAALDGLSLLSTGLIATTAPPWSAGAAVGGGKLGIGGGLDGCRGTPFGGAGMLGGYPNLALGFAGPGSILGAARPVGAKGLLPNAHPPTLGATGATVATGAMPKPRLEFGLSPESMLLSARSRCLRPSLVLLVLRCWFMVVSGRPRLDGSNMVGSPRPIICTI